MSVTIALSEPIQFGSESVAELKLRKPKAKDFRRMPTNPNIGELLDLAGQLAAQPRAVMDELSVDDMAKVLDVVGDFMQGGRATGPTP